MDSFFPISPKDVEFQKALESLYSRVDLPALLKSLDFDRMAAGVNYPALGARSRLICKRGNDASSQLAAAELNRHAPSPLRAASG